MKSSEIKSRLSEKQLQEMVIDLARARGWMAYHTYDSRRSAPGFPDLVLARGGVVIFAELKSNSGRVTKQQQEWLNELTAFSEPGCDPSHEVAVWRPEDWPEIERMLSATPGLEEVDGL